VTDSGDDPLLVTLASVERELRAFHQRAVHREAVIDRLHSDNQALREGQIRTALQPVLTDLAKLYDGLIQQAQRLASEAEAAAEHALWASFADDVAMALERYGADIVTARPGETYDRGRHVAVSFVGNTDLSAGGTVAQMIGVGLVDQESGQMRRPVRVRVYQTPAPLSDATAE
jgi:molecular chaperone GrpE (heat shock protein)